MSTLILLLIVSQTSPYQEAYNKHKEESKPLVIMVKQDRCPPCKAMSDELQWQDKKDRVYVEIDISHPVARKLRTRVTPTLYMFTNNNKKMTYVGYQRGTAKLMEDRFIKFVRTSYAGKIP